MAAGSGVWKDNEEAEKQFRDLRSQNEHTQSSLKLDEWITIGRTQFEEHLAAKDRDKRNNAKANKRPLAPNHDRVIHTPLHSLMSRESDVHLKHSMFASFSSHVRDSEHDDMRGTMSFGDPKEKELHRFQKYLDKSGNSSERAVLIAPIMKTNDHGKTQKRLLVVTDAAVYNCSTDGKEVKRRIAFDLIEAITIDVSGGSGVGRQMAIHVPSEYDYLLAVPDKANPIEREEIVNAIKAAHFAAVRGSGKPELPVDVFRMDPSDPKSLPFTSVLSKKKK